MGTDELELPYITGRGLRMILVNEMMVRHEITVAEMVDVVSTMGFHLPGRASKVISDALRWEVRAGRVQRVRRGVYRFVSAPKSRIRRTKILAARSRAWIVATTRNTTLPSTPPDHRRPPARPPARPPESRNRAPWADLGWLWNC